MLVQWGSETREKGKSEMETVYKHMISACVERERDEKREWSEMNWGGGEYRLGVGERAKKDGEKLRDILIGYTIFYGFSPETVAN